MATNFPGSLDTSTQQPSPSSTTDLDASGYEHDVVHTNHSGAIIALETKLGSTDSNPTANAVLMGTGSGTSEWDTSPTFKGAVTVGVDDTGHDVKFFAATAGDYFLWDESAGQVIIESTGDAAAGSASGILRIGAIAGSHLAIDGNEIMAKSDATTAGTLYLQNDGGTVKFGNNTALTQFYVKATEFHLQSGSDVTPDSDWDGQLTIAGNGYAGGLALDGSGMWVGHNSSARDLILAVNETERLLIDNTSAVELRGLANNEGAYFKFTDSDGDTMSYVGSPGNDDLHLRCSASGGYLYMAAGGTWKFYSASTSTSGFLPYSDNTFDLGASSLRFDDVYATNGTIQTSDVNLKKDITNATLGLNFINALRPVEYKWKEGSRKHQGFIAQEVKTVLDDQDAAAEQALWGLNTIKEGTRIVVPVTDENGIPQKTEVDNEERQSLRYTELIAPLVKAVQELTTRVAALEG